MKKYFFLLLLAGCASEPPEMTEEPGVRPWGHVELCRREPEHEFCSAD